MPKGRYDSVRTIAEIGPEWARGCENCTYGLVSAPEITGMAPHYLERLVQAIDGDIHFCTCQAGSRYRTSLLNRRQQLIEEARKDSRMREYAEMRSHPDIENARMAIMVVRVPTVHAAEPVPQGEPA